LVLNDKDKYPFISVVIPCYKAELYIARAIDSVLAQEYVNIQVLVVEDGIVDNTKSIVSAYDERVEHIILKTNQGASAARNTGLEKANSDYVMFLDADDYLEGKLLIGLHDAINNKKASIAFGPCIKRWEEKKLETTFFPPAEETPLMVVERWLKGNSGPNPSSVLWKTSEIKRIGGWNEDFSRNQDGELIIRAMLNGCTVAASFSGAGIYRMHENESVSKHIYPSTFDTQEQIENYVRDWLEKNSNKEIEKALNIYRFRNAVDAYRNGLVEVGDYWKKKWKKHGGKVTGLPGFGLKKLIITAIYITFGLKYGEYLILRIRRLLFSLRGSWNLIKSKEEEAEIDL